MKLYLVIFILISIISGLLAYYVSGSLIISICVGTIFLAYFIFAYKKIIEKYKKDIAKIHECYFFINNFVISLSVQNSYKEAYEKVNSNKSSFLTEIMSHIEHLPIKDRLEYLKEYFNFDIYFHFLNLLELYEEQGGNILNMGKLLLEENARCENTLNESIRIGRGKLVEFSVLWIITFAILGIARLALNNFFDMIKGIVIYKVAICVFFLLVLVSIHVMLISYRSVCVRKEKAYA